MFEFLNRLQEALLIILLGLIRVLCDKSLCWGVNPIEQSLDLRNGLSYDLLLVDLGQYNTCLVLRHLVVIVSVVLILSNRVMSLSHMVEISFSSHTFGLASASPSSVASAVLDATLAGFDFSKRDVAHLVVHSQIMIRLI